MMSRKGNLFWAGIVASVLGLVIYGLLPKAIEVDVVSPTIGPLEIVVEDDGETRIREKYVLFAPVTGKMLRVDVHAGDEVVADETLLARIEPSDPSLLDARTRSEAEARVRVAIASASQVDAEVNRAEQGLELAKRDFDRADKLIHSSAISQAEYDATENRLRFAQAELRSAKSAQKVAGYEIDQARAAIQYLRTQFDPEGNNVFDVLSPIDGKVLDVLREDSGVVTAGTPIIQLGDTRDLEIIVDVLSTEAVKIEAGDEVIVQHWGGPVDLFAQVRLVEPSAFLKVSALGVEEKRVNVIADFVGPVEKRMAIGDGFRIEARIVTERTAPDTLALPTSSLIREDDDWFVFLVGKGERAEKRRIEVGQSSGLFTEIRSGIGEDDRIINHPSRDVEEGVLLKSGA